MNTKKTTQTFVIALAMMITLTIGSTMVFGQDKANKRSIDEPGNTLVGVWQSTVTSYDCQTGAPFGDSIKSLFTFMQGGTMSEDNNDPLDGPYRNSAHGIWKRTSGRNYTTVFLHQSFAPDRSFTYTIKVRANITLSPFFESFTASSTFEVYDPSDNLVFTGCGNEKATRLTF
jgi:hypothetical protein